MLDSRFGIKILALMTTSIEADRQATAAGQWVTSNSVMSSMLAPLQKNSGTPTNQVQVNLQHVLNTFKTILK